MVCMASPDKEWVTVAETAKLAGCTVGWVRMLLLTEQLSGWKAGARAWLIKRTDAEGLKKTLTIRSVGKRETKPKPPKKRKTR
jgi:hypothetical protein